MRDLKETSIKLNRKELFLLQIGSKVKCQLSIRDEVLPHSEIELLATGDRLIFKGEYGMIYVVKNLVHKDGDFVMSHSTFKFYKL